ncbi:hypothetical protein Poly51_58250 [Rubripirellula tenax]|uniref:Bacterial type II/III secretion system short domain protein n=1 Tax=Rubripirellula tenax TaxID=2528015 RepID=A0A5C6EC77_9BACT|nr:hypothetical protein [Rubripirellula tenax]TWU44759.1 hypothetical protein Poly51_58250 [Rubripirellula tenax]
MKSKTPKWRFSLSCLLAAGLLMGCDDQVDSQADAQTQSPIQPQTQTPPEATNTNYILDENLPDASEMGAMDALQSIPIANEGLIFDGSERDTRLMSVATNDCMFFAMWPAWEVNHQSTHPVDRLIANELVRDPFEKLIARAGLTTAAMNAGFADAQTPSSLLSSLIETSPEFAKVVLGSAGSAYADANFNLTERSVQFEAAIVLKTGEKTRLVLDQLRRSFQAQAAESVSMSLGGEDFVKIELSKRKAFPPLLLGSIEDEFLVVAVGEGSAEGVLQRISGKQTAPWLQEEIQSGNADGMTHFARANLERVVPLAVAVSKEAQLIVSAGRFDEAKTLTLKAFKTVSGTQQQIELVGKDSLFEGASSASMNKNELAHVPADAALAVGTVVNMNQWYQSAIESMSRVSQDNGQEFQRDVERTTLELVGLPIDKALGAFGNQLTVSASSDADLVHGVVYRLSIKNRKVVEEMNRKLLEKFTSVSSRRVPTVREIPFGKNTIFTWMPTRYEYWFEPAWCITDTHLMVAHSPEALKHVLTSPEDDRSLANDGEFATLSNEGRLMNAGVLDAHLLTKLAYPFARVGLNQLKVESLRSLDSGPPEQQFALATIETDLPPLKALLDNMSRVQFETRIDDDRITFDVLHSLPVFDPVGLAAKGVVAAMPMVRIDQAPRDDDTERVESDSRDQVLETYDRVSEQISAGQAIVVLTPNDSDDDMPFMPADLRDSSEPPRQYKPEVAPKQFFDQEDRSTEGPSQIPSRIPRED